MNGQRETGPRRYSASLRNAAEALYGARAKRALGAAIASDAPANAMVAQERSPGRRLG